MTTAPCPLKGIRVLDFGHTIMGPCAGHVLADLGADVIKIEPVDGDPTRRLPGFAAGFFTTYNRNKRSIAIDLKTAEGQAIVHRLVEKADVALENFGPGTIERLNCDWETLGAINPRLIFLSMKGYLKGPYENRGALDEVVQMQSGLAYMTGPPGMPLRAGASIIDILGGVFGVVAVLSALRERDATGKGQRVGSSLFESAAFLLAPLMAGSAAIGAPLPPMPARKNPWGIYDVFSARDGRQAFIGVTSDQHWYRFCSSFGFLDLKDNPLLKSNTTRCNERSWLLPQIEARLALLDLDEILAKCEEANIPYSRVGRPDELRDDPHLNAGGLVEVALDTLGGGLGNNVALPALPVEFGRERARPALSAQPPSIGQHTLEILLEAGVSINDAEQLIKRNIARAASHDF
jgi:crotonobetainyl-CoA:carnitine CoA-transferase CaiB-like acyl-CoA transferase